MKSDDLFSYLMVTDQLDEFLGLKNIIKCPNCNKELYKYSSEDINNINKFLSYYKEFRIPSLNKMINKDLNQERYLQNIIKIQEEKQDIIDWFNKIKANEKNVVQYNTNNVKYKPVKKSHHKMKKTSVLGSILLGLFDGLSDKSKERERKRMHDKAIRELEKGNPEDYTDLYDYLDDEIVGREYPIEQEDEDDYD